MTEFNLFIWAHLLNLDQNSISLLLLCAVALAYILYSKWLVGGYAYYENDFDISCMVFWMRNTALYKKYSADSTVYQGQPAPASTHTDGFSTTAQQQDASTTAKQQDASTNPWSVGVSTNPWSVGVSTSPQGQRPVLKPTDQGASTGPQEVITVKTVPLVQYQRPDPGPWPAGLPEQEAELVAGYNVEYQSMGFQLFFIQEYQAIIMMGTLTSLLFLGGTAAPISLLSWIPGSIWLALKTTAIVFIFIWVRQTLPRYRYDQLMNLGWKALLPITLAAFVFNQTLVLCFQLVST